MIPTNISIGAVIMFSLFNEIHTEAIASKLKKQHLKIVDKIIYITGKKYSPLNLIVKQQLETELEYIASLAEITDTVVQLPSVYYTCYIRDSMSTYNRSIELTRKLIQKEQLVCKLKGKKFTKEFIEESIIRTYLPLAWTIPFITKETLVTYLIKGMVASHEQIIVISHTPYNTPYAP